MASERQVKFALHLLKESGFSTRFMDAKFASLGAGMRERSGTVEAWLRGKNTADISALIETLKARTDTEQST